MRIFIGSMLSTEQQIQINDLQNSLSTVQKARCVKWTPKQKLHLTWLFLDEIAPREVANLRSNLAESIAEFFSESSISGNVLQISFDKISFWPNLDSPRVLVLEALHANPDVYRLAEKIRYCARNFIPESRIIHGFKPHITMARMRPGSETSNELSGLIGTEVQTFPERTILRKTFTTEVAFDCVQIIESQSQIGSYAILDTINFQDH